MMVYQSDLTVLPSVSLIRTLRPSSSPPPLLAKEITDKHSRPLLSPASGICYKAAVTCRNWVYGPGAVDHDGKSMTHGGECLPRG